MRVIEPHEFKEVKHPKSKTKRRLRGRLLAVGILVVYVAASLLRPVPAITATVSAVAPSAKQNVVVAWPSYGQAAIGAVGYGILDTHGEQKSLPMASVTKVMTALAVLKQKPLQLGEQGPVLTMTRADVEEYNRTIAADGSNVPVEEGEEITQYQALQALLLPSANNMAQSLVRWAYGSEADYLYFVNNFAKSLGMEQTVFDDASGYSPKTRSTAADLARLAVNAMDNPVIAEIANQQEANIPVAGRILNVNMLLGRDGIVGIKTGNTDEAGGCFMAAAVRVIDGQKITAVSVIMGAPDIQTALRDSVPLVNSVLDGFNKVVFVKAGDTVAQYGAPWSSSSVVAASELSGVTWRGSTLSPHTSLRSISGAAAAKTEVGTVSVQLGRQPLSVPLRLKNDITAAPMYWRLVPRW